jgi:cytochrome P450 family 3 subfamily A
MYNSTASLDKEHALKYGSVYGIFEGSKPILMIHDPLILQQVYKSKFTDFAHRLSDKDHSLHSFKSKNFLYANGDDMMKIRTTISNTMNEDSLNRMMDRIKHKDLLLILHASEGQPVSIGEVFLPFCFNVGAGTTYGIDLNMYNNPSGEEVIGLAEQVSILGMPIVALPYSMYCLVQRLPLWFTKLTGLIPDGKRSHDFFVNLIREAFVRAENNLSGDMADSFGHALKSGLLSEDQDLNNSINIIGANALSLLDLLTFVLYFMAKNQEHQELVWRELKTAASDMSFKSLANLNYSSAFIMETLRLFPIEVRTYRHVTSDSGANVPGMNIHL